MLTIARTLMGNPEVLLIDEPTEGLAPLIVKTVEQVIQDIHQHNIPVLLVEQNMRVALRLAGRIYVISKGKIVFHGTSQELKEAHEVRQKYLRFNPQERSPYDPSLTRKEKKNAFEEKMGIDVWRR